MKSILKFSALSVAIFMFLYTSCKKEYSCEGCRGNKPPIAIAGPGQVITVPTDSISLDGSASNDPDGTITSWLWTKISGPASFQIVNTANAVSVVKNLVTGVYQFELKVTDNDGLSAKDTIQVTVNHFTPGNHPPVADAGPDQTITLPANNVAVDGSASTDPDNNITSYLWTKISGPPAFTIANSNAVQTGVTNLAQGVYQFELTVTDAGGLLAKDTMQVTVINEPAPCMDCKIVFVSERDGDVEIYSCNANGSNIQRLTNNAGIDAQPVWSPDRTKIAFTSDRSGNRELYIMNADGSNVLRRTFSGTFIDKPAWSPDGTRIMYSTFSNGSANIWVVGATGGSPSPLLEATGWEVQATWSPDGTRVALVSDWAAYDFVYDIYILNADGTGSVALTKGFQDKFDYLNPDWSPNGTKLAVAISERTGIDEYETQIGTMNTDGSGLTAIKPGAASWTRTAWSADGSKILYTSFSGSGYDVAWVSADGSASEIIVTNASDADW